VAYTDVAGDHVDGHHDVDDAAAGGASSAAHRPAWILLPRRNGTRPPLTSVWPLGTVALLPEP